MPVIRDLTQAISAAPTDVLLLYVVTGTLFVLCALILALAIQQRRQRLNWYEQNLLEIATSPPQYVRCKAIPRLDTDDDRDYDWPMKRWGSEGDAINNLKSALFSPPFFQTKPRKQSRIQSLTNVCRPPPIGDLSDAFHVPRLGTPQKSMFRSLDQSQIDRGLYQTTMDAESGYDEESCGNGGSIKVALSMDNNLGLLTVELKQAVDLVAKRQDGYPNPYFKVKLDVPESSEPKIQQQSKVYKNTSSPVVEEEFFFQVCFSPPKL